MCWVLLLFLNQVNVGAPPFDGDDVSDNVDVGALSLNVYGNGRESGFMLSGIYDGAVHPELVYPGIKSILIFVRPIHDIFVLSTASPIYSFFR